MHFDTWIETASSLMALSTLLLIPLYLKWMLRANSSFAESGLITVKEDRSIFKNFKLEQKHFALVAPLRKVIMAFSLVAFQGYPQVQIVVIIGMSMVNAGMIVRSQALKKRWQNKLKIIAEL